MSELIWAAVIAQAKADIERGGIYQAREAYNFMFAPGHEDDLKAVCCYAHLNYEVEREKAMALDIPMRVRMA
jgi:hypothetical protein